MKEKFETGTSKASALKRKLEDAASRKNGSLRAKYPAHYLESFW